MSRTRTFLNPLNDSGICMPSGDPQEPPEINLPSTPPRRRGSTPSDPDEEEDGDMHRSPGGSSHGTPSSAGAISPSSTRPPLSPDTRMNIRMHDMDEDRDSTGTNQRTPLDRSPGPSQGQSPTIPEPNYDLDPCYDIEISLPDDTLEIVIDDSP